MPRENERQSAALPKPPLNVFIISPYVNGVLDIRWDDPKIIPENTQWQILGVNIYRSFDSESGPFTLVNPQPLGAGVYRDITTNTFVQNEVVTNLSRGLNPQKEWRFQTKFYPVVQNVLETGLEQGLATKSDIQVKVDNGDSQGLIEVPVFRFTPETGDVTLISTGIVDPETEKIIPPRLPLNQPGALTISYYFNSNLIKSRLHNRIFYKLTTVAMNKDGAMIESDIEYVPAINLYQQEKTDWVWREAIRRNRWILEQGGERVKVFIRKWNGQLCNSFSDIHENSPNDCPICYGTNYVGGYEGPFDIIVAPPDAAKNVELSETGLRVNYTFETWTGPSPMLNKRDIVVRPTGERFTVGAINYVGQRGAIFQQTFSLQQLDSQDIVYKLAVDGAQTQPAAPFDTRSERDQPAQPIIPDNKPENRNYPRETGRTVTFEDIMY